MHARSRRLAALAALALLLPVLASAGALTPDLQARYDAVAPGTPLPVIVRFGERVSPSDYAGGKRTAPALVKALRDAAAGDQAGVMALLASRGLAGRAKVLWIANALALEAPADLAKTLAERSDVQRVEFDEPVSAEPGTPDAGPVGVLDQAPVWSLIKVNAPRVWSELGLTGTGLVVGSMDTGADITHPALAGKWRGGSNSWKDLVNGLLAPYDDHGHGTHTIGTMVGGDAAGAFAPDIGLAPDARFISVKVLNSSNSFSSASIVIAGAQWILDPDGVPATNDFPDVVNNSWFFNSSTYTGFWSSMDAWRAAGIVPVFCAANFGPTAGSIRPPGSYDNVIGVGATDSLGAIASFSSRGPSPLGAGFPADQRKPDLSAPGQSVTSSLPGGTYANWNGTSMATPAVTATAALMLQANPSLTVAQIRDRLIASAVDRGAPGFDFDFGWGQLDTYGAVAAAVADAPLAGPAGTVALRAWPNPSRGAVHFASPADAGDGATLDVLDLQGRRVWSAPVSAHAVLRWDGRDAHGAPVAAGLYLVRLADGTNVRHGRVLMLR